MENKLAEISKKLLTDKKVDFVIGYGKDNRPIFISKTEDAGKLVWNKDCYNNLAVYLTKDFVKKAKRIAIVAKGCDVKAIVGLIQENQITRDKIVIIAIVCNGVGEPILEKCKFCDVKTPKLYDHLVGDTIESKPIKNKSGFSFEGQDKYTDVEEFEKKSEREKKVFWDRELSKCIKCYACRAVCPLCYCSKCIVEKNQPQWIPTSPHQHGNFVWNFMRSFHLAGRCIGCGECERNCPVGIPLTLLNKKTALEVKRNFGYEAGYDFEKEPALVCFSKEDNEDFIR